MTIPTLAELAASCADNRRRAEMAMQRVKQDMARLAPGPGPDRDHLLVGLSQAQADYEHWSSYVAYYKARVSAEGGTARPSLTGRQGFAVKPQRPPAQGRATREPGSDDDLPF